MVQLKGRRRRPVVKESPNYKDTEDGEAVPLQHTRVSPYNGHSSDLTQASIGKPRKVSSTDAERSRTSTPESTPQKVRRNSSRTSTTPSGKSKPIYSFFNAITRQQQVSNEQTGSLVSKEPPGLNTEPDFDLDDILSSDDDKTHISTSRKRSRDDVEPVWNPKTEPSDNHQRGPVPKFIRSSSGRTPSLSRNPSKAEPSIDTRPWAEKYSFQSLDELGIHKKKLQDTRLWLEGAFNNAHPHRLLILKGPAGCGKTATIQALAPVLKYRLTEWQSPGVANADSSTYVSLSNAFEEFITRSTSVSSLELVSVDGAATQEEFVGSSSTPVGRQVVLIEEFPVLTSRSSTALDAFRSTLLQYLAAKSQRRTDEQTLIVLIVTESTVSQSSSNADNFTVNRLLGREILAHPVVTVIEYNTVAPTILTKALKTILQKHSKASQRHVALDPMVLNRVAEIGDLRNAISTLEYLCTYPSEFTKDESERGVKQRSAKSANKTTATCISRERALELISLRESSIGLFHAIGKIVYNKRSTPGTDSKKSFAVHRNNLSTAKPASEVDLDILIDSSGTDTSTFICGIHENFMQSCYTADEDSENTLDAVNSCLDALCDADQLMNVRSRGQNSSTTAESVRQETFAFEVACRAVLDSLPYPVQRRSVPTSAPKKPDKTSKAFGRGDSHRMFYPQSLKIWRPREEVIDKLDHLVRRVLNGSLAKDLENVSKLWSRSTSQPGRMPVMPQRITDGIHLGSGQSPRLELLLDRLPYLAQLIPRGPIQMGIQVPQRLIDEFDSIVKITGEDPSQVSDDEGGPPVGHALKASSKARSESAFGLQMSTEDIGVEKLVISDDDIEDD